jgi:hypothetical protein
LCSDVSSGRSSLWPRALKLSQPRASLRPSSPALFLAELSITTDRRRRSSAGPRRSIGHRIAHFSFPRSRVSRSASPPTPWRPGRAELTPKEAKISGQDVAGVPHQASSRGARTALEQVRCACNDVVMREGMNERMRAGRRPAVDAAPEQPEMLPLPDLGAGPRVPFVRADVDGHDRMRRWLLQRKQQLGTRTERVVIPAERIRR